MSVASKGGTGYQQKLLWPILTLLPNLRVRSEVNHGTYHTLWAFVLTYSMVQSPS